MRSSVSHPLLIIDPMINNTFFLYFFGGLECVGHSFAYVAHFVFLRDFWIRTQARYQISYPSPFTAYQYAITRNVPFCHFLGVHVFRMFMSTVKAAFGQQIFKSKRHKIFSSFEYLGMHKSSTNPYYTFDLS
jgi:hypothetical protein